ncbi:MAG: hypothetical protein ACFFFG_12565 [Candidatus Thorarchaeota archaeon]
MNCTFIKDEKLLKKLAFILGGVNRIKVFISLSEGIKTARDVQIDLAKGKSIHLTSICRTLKALKTQQIITCLNTDHQVGKLYSLFPDVTQLTPLVKCKAYERGLL